MADPTINQAEPVQATQTPTKAPKGAKDAAGELRSALIQLILDDPDIEQALRLTLGLALTKTDPSGYLGSSDAEHAANLQDLIEQTLTRMVRGDALRRQPIQR
jgi:hypothetical protein